MLLWEWISCVQHFVIVVSSVWFLFILCNLIVTHILNIFSLTLLSVSHDESLPADPTLPRSAVQTAWCQYKPPISKFFLCSSAYGKEELQTLSFKNSVSLTKLFLKILVLPSSNLIFHSKFHETQNSSILPQTCEGARAAQTFKLWTWYYVAGINFWHLTLMRQWT